jgi:hypothetical protein
MGTLRGDNGGERPQDGNGLPDLPPEWGTVVVPDDASALDDDGVLVRRRFRYELRKRRWRRRLHLRPGRPLRLDDDAPGLAVPLLIMTIAVLATLTSLFAVAWPGQRRPTTNRPAPAVSAVAASNTVSTARLADVTLAGEGGAARLYDLVPAVVLVVDDCTCAELIAETAGALASTSPRLDVPVLVVGLTRPALPSLGAGTAAVRAYADASRALPAAVPGLGGERPSAVLLGPGPTVVRVVPKVRSVADFRADLERLN